MLMLKETFSIKKQEFYEIKKKKKKSTFQFIYVYVSVLYRKETKVN